MLPAGLARSPIWFDTDRDGSLHLLVANTRQDNAGSVFFRQRKDGSFEPASEACGFRDERWSRLEERAAGDRSC